MLYVLDAMEGISQKGVVVSEVQFKKSSSNNAVSRFIPMKDSQWHYRIDGPSISFWRPDEAAPFGGWRFADGCRIVTACSMPFSDGSDGIVIGVNNFSSSRSISFLAYYSFSRSSVIKMIAIKNEVTCVFVLIGNLDKTKILELNQSLRNAPHWIAVGTKGGCCYLTHFNLEYPTEIDLRISSPVFSTNISKHYTQNNSLAFSTEQGNVTINLEKVCVTAMSYIPKCWLLLIGFSCGVVVSFSLSPSVTRMLYFMHDGPVHSFAWQEPNDDPRPTFYLWIAHDAAKKRIKNIRSMGPQVLLTSIVFPDDEGKPFHEWSYKYPWSPNAISHWVSIRTILQSETADRIIRHADRSTSFDESSTSIGFVDSTLLLLAWVNQKGTALQGALFDLNALYYKRLVKSIIFDETVAHQCPFLSLFTIMDIRNETASIQDVVASSDSLIRFSGPLSESNDALFYPSALSFEAVVLQINRRLAVEIRSIQEQVLEVVESDIVDAVGANVNIAAQWMAAVGLADPSCVFAINTEWYEASQIITGLLNHGCIHGLKNWLENHADEASRDDFTKFLWDFVQDTKEHFDENSSGVFAKISTAPPKWTISWLKSAYFVFNSAEELFGMVQSSICSKECSQYAEIECHRRASANLTLYTRLVLFMLKQNILPESSNYGNIWATLKNSVDERCSRALLSGKKLFIHELLEEIKRYGKDEDFWSDVEVTELYPPRTLLVLLDPVLALQITATAKLKLMGYFFMDFDRITERNVFAIFRNAFLPTESQVADQIIAKYEADCSFRPIDEGNSVYNNVNKCTDPASDFTKLMKCPLLDDEQYGIIKNSLLKENGGVTKWNDFCIARHQLHRLVEPTKDKKDSDWENTCDLWTRRFIKEIPRLKSGIIPAHILNNWMNIYNARTPVTSNFTCVTRRRPKRRTTLHEALAEFRSAMELRKRKNDDLDETIESKRMKTPEPDIDLNLSPVGDNDALELERVLPKENLERIKRILQTPPLGRTLCRSKNGNLLTNSEITPDNVPVVQPTSILKSGAKRRLHRDSESGSPHPRLRFDLPSLDLESSFISTSSSFLHDVATDDDESSRLDDNHEDVPTSFSLSEKSMLHTEASGTNQCENAILSSNNENFSIVVHCTDWDAKKDAEGIKITSKVSYSEKEEESKVKRKKLLDSQKLNSEGELKANLFGGGETKLQNINSDNAAKPVTVKASLQEEKGNIPIKTRRIVKETCYEVVVSPCKGNSSVRNVDSKEMASAVKSLDFLRTKEEDIPGSCSSEEQLATSESAEYVSGAVSLKNSNSECRDSRVPAVTAVTEEEEEFSKTKTAVESISSSVATSADAGEGFIQTTFVSKTRVRTYSSMSSPETSEDQSVHGSSRVSAFAGENMPKRRNRVMSYSEVEISKASIPVAPELVVGRPVLRSAKKKSEKASSEGRAGKTPRKGDSELEKTTCGRPGLRSADKVVNETTDLEETSGKTPHDDISESQKSPGRPGLRSASKTLNKAEGSSKKIAHTDAGLESPGRLGLRSSDKALDEVSLSEEGNKKVRNLEALELQKSSGRSADSKKRTRKISHSETSGRKKSPSRSDLRDVDIHFGSVNEENNEQAVKAETTGRRKNPKRSGLRSASELLDELPVAEVKRSPSRNSRASSVLSTASAPETLRQSSPAPSRAPKRGRRAASEVPQDKEIRSSSRRRTSSEDESGLSNSKRRTARIRAGRKSVYDMLKTIEEESPSRVSTRLRRTPIRYPE
uniref:ELYS-bb domain-containing protein n=1 Tax=Syphacia muris TaxID=451379 RepID=A0A0N5ADP3_9BILA